MVRAHVAALGGNAVVSYSMKECVLMENPNKNQVLLHSINKHSSFTKPNDSLFGPLDLMV